MFHLLIIYIYIYMSLSSVCVNSIPRKNCLVFLTNFLIPSSVQMQVPQMCRSIRGQWQVGKALQYRNTTNILPFLYKGNENTKIQTTKIKKMVSSTVLKLVLGEKKHWEYTLKSLELNRKANIKDSISWMPSVFANLLTFTRVHQLTCNEL